jgi:hypothetical protein
VTQTLPFINRERPLIRILYADTFNLGAGPWIELPMARRGRLGFGWELLKCSRTCLPATGEATLRFRYGRIDDVLVAPGQVGAWAGGSDDLGLLDLTGKEIRIQAAPRTPGTPAWRTVWWGQCEYQRDQDWPAAAVPAGERLYLCVDGLARTRRWPMDRHGVYVGGAHYDDVQGHPGYNVQDAAGLTRGNREGTEASYDPTGDTDAKCYYHAWQGGASTQWTDQQAIEHALRATRPKGEPLFNLYGSTTFYSQSGTAWDISETGTVFDFIGRVCRRQRGRGCVFVEWVDDTGNPTGPLSVRLTARPQTLADVVYTNPAGGGGVVTLAGATTAATTSTVDLIGDHRVAHYELGDRFQHRYDSVETVGEPIEVLATLSNKDGTDLSLSKRWATASETAFQALSADKRIDEAWRTVWQLWGLPRDWQGKAGDHNAGASAPVQRIDYRCDDLGNVTVGSINDTSPLLVSVMSDLPLLEGYTYTSAPARKDGASESGTPPRRPPFLMIRTDADKYLHGDECTPALNLHVSADGILVFASADISDQGAFRAISDYAQSGLGTVYDWHTLGLTVGLRLPHHARMRTFGTTDAGDAYDAITARRRLRIELPGVHLWVAPTCAIWDLDTANRTNAGSPGRRVAGGFTLGDGDHRSMALLRDDRAALALHHALACAWYLADRRTATWTLRDCGLLPSFTSVTDASQQTGTAVTYPVLGQLLTTLSAAGQNLAINTPITSIVYDNESCETTWATDWQELDFQ